VFVEPITTDVVVDPRPAEALPDSIDRTMISEAIGKVMPQVMACRDQSPVKGRVLVSVRVAAGGCVIEVIVQSAPHPALGSCVAAAIQNATFARTERGGSFRYPFVF
jgi:outer membrane biosynthesis protein TonB